MSGNQDGLGPIEEQADPGEQRADAGSRLTLAARRRLQLDRARTTYRPLRRLLDFLLRDADAEED